MEVLPKYTYDNWQERIGVHKVGLLLTELGLIFRESSYSDVGIDGQIEYVNNVGEATGKIAAVQIKSGDSYLYYGKSDRENWTFYPNEKHKFYWEKFPIPVRHCPQYCGQCPPSSTNVVSFIHFQSVVILPLIILSISCLTCFQLTSVPICMVSLPLA